MVNFPYTLKPSSLEDFLKNMADRPEPAENVTPAYLKSLGYTSSTERTIFSILKFINFLDSRGTPTNLFRSFRDTRKSRAVMAQALIESYSGLFQLHSDPCKASDTDLENFFRTETGRGGRMLRATVDAFKTLRLFADFGALIPAPKPTPTPPTPIKKPPVTKESMINLNVNIRLELPATKDADVYDEIFQSIKKHLLTLGSKTD